MEIENKQVLHLGPGLSGLALCNVFKTIDGNLNAWVEKEGRLFTLDEFVNCFFNDPRQNWKKSLFCSGELLDSFLQTKGISLNDKFRLPFPCANQ